MKNQIKETFNQIHAPKELIEETKLMIHNNEDKKSYKPAIAIISGIASVAACIIICIHLPFFNLSSGQGQQAASPSDMYNNSVSSSSGIEYIDSNSQYYSNWFYLINTMQDESNTTTSLELKNTLVFNSSYEYNDENTYTFKYIITKGLLYYNKDKLMLDGELVIKVYNDINMPLSTITFQLKDSSLFIEDTPWLIAKDINHDGNNEIFLDCLSSKWYTLDENYKLIPCKE